MYFTPDYSIRLINTGKTAYLQQNGAHQDSIFALSSGKLGLYHGYGIFANPALPDVRHYAYG